tara:strand:- start:585 stop:770 length:186 start_codon:yes stop_codon:yes gene_type:complete
MKTKTAMNVLEKDMKFLGMTFQELCTFIENSPYAQKNSTIKAYKIIKNRKFQKDYLKGVSL